MALYVISRWNWGLKKAFLRGLMSFCKLIVLFSIVRIVFLLLLTFLLFLLLLTTIEEGFTLLTSCLCFCWRPAVAVVPAGVPAALSVPTVLGVPTIADIPVATSSSLLRMLPKMFKLSLLKSLMFPRPCCSLVPDVPLSLMFPCPCYCWHPCCSWRP